MCMTLHIDLSKLAEERLRERAAAAGVDVTKYAAGVLERATSRPMSIEEISGPIAEEFRKSGMSEDQLTELLERTKHEVRGKRRAS